MFPSSTPYACVRTLLFAFLFGSTLFFSTDLSAQSLTVGAEVGRVFEPVDVVTTVADGAVLEETTIEAQGWTAGVFGTLKIAGPLSFHAELLYTTYSGIETSTTWGNTSTPVTTDVFALPVSFRVDFGSEGIVPFVYAGTTLGVIADVFDPDYMGSRSERTVQKRRGSMSATGDLGAGVIFPISPAFGIRFEGRASWDLVGLDPVRTESWEFGRAIGLVGANIRLF